jgi:hypothetical protein
MVRGAQPGVALLAPDKLMQPGFHESLNGRMPEKLFNFAQG